MLQQERWRNLQRKADTLWQRTWDRHMRLAVTGLARSGKTAFVTALIQQLEQAGFNAKLPHWQVLQQGRLLGVQQVVQLHQHIPTFGYTHALSALAADPPQWPEPTQTLSEIRLELRFRSQHLLRQKIGQDICKLYLDIVDYPGEWLLDLPLLELSYAQWSAQIRGQLQSPSRRHLAEPWLQAGSHWSAAQPFSNMVDEISHVAALYTNYLHDCRSQLGLQSIQPGRFVLPGEYAGAPLLQFVPWVWALPEEPATKDSIYGLMQARYEAYKEHVIKRFYQQHFSGFDRQIVLVDCLQPLKTSHESLADLQNTLGQILKSFQYGNSHWWQRLFSPRIDKLLFVASKADHVTPEQHPALLSLLRELVHSGLARARFEGISLECMAMAAIRASEYHRVDYQGQPLTILHGVDLQGHELALFPGTIPPQIPAADFWQNPALRLTDLRPPSWTLTQPRPHIRLDQVLEYLLGDKMQ
ncbi:YcjX family protein [Tolumonas lignilytica]|uniref:YcjX family protein n=1 Tax=Tolumonas lignilytica TaxID=1283284 RepID=UPI000465581C|nr:YcjX family protein [Tolumonas lignilytica]